MGQLSPDGRWLAYTTNASGIFQVMVQPFAPAFEKPLAAKWQISTAGGHNPVGAATAKSSTTWRRTAN